MVSGKSGKEKNGNRELKGTPSKRLNTGTDYLSKIIFFQPDFIDLRCFKLDQIIIIHISQVYAIRFQR